MKNVITLLAAGIIVMLAACKKEDALNKQALSSKAYAVRTYNLTPITLVANPQNPYDSIGMIHNQVLSLACNYVIRTKDTIANGIRNQVSIFFTGRYGTDINDKLKQADLHFLKTFPERKISFITSNPVSQPVTNYCNQILNSIQQVKDSTNYPVFYNNMILLERKVLSDKSLSLIQSQQILAAASIARYSVAFWLGIETNDVVMPMGFFGRIWNAINCGLADAGGAIDGIFSGGSIRDILEEASFESALCSAFM